jgi:SPP1 family predicted phage head-tail adaptor
MPQVPTQIGQYNRRVTLAKRSATTNAMNEQVFAWDDKQTVWARITQLFSALTYQTQTFESKATSAIFIRWNRAISINIGDRVRYTDPSTSVVTLYEIESANNVNMQNREIQMQVYVLDGNQ